MTNLAHEPGSSACGRLVGRAFTLYEFPSLVDTIFSSKDERDRINSLRRDDAQSFIDVMDEALDGPGLSSQTWEKCLKLLYRTCGRHELLPKSLVIPVCCDITGDPVYRGGCADVRKGNYRGQDVAVKVVRTYSDSDLQKIVSRFCKEAVTWKFLRHPNVLPLMGVTISESRFAMISNWMANGNINDFVKSHPEVDRRSLLVGVTQGLIYIHNRGMIHGDLKGSNILIDRIGNARIADFGLLTVISDPENPLGSASYTQGGTARWMSPELIDPQRFGLKNSCPTTSSDCYALGMVIYETISGHVPFHEHTDITVFVNVLKGGRPRREDWFTDGLWKLLKRCWAPHPKKRPSIEDVLQYLERAPNAPDVTKRWRLSSLFLKSRPRVLPSAAFPTTPRDNCPLPGRGPTYSLNLQRPVNSSLEFPSERKNSREVWHTVSGPSRRHTSEESPLGTEGPITVPRIGTRRGITLPPATSFSQVLWDPEPGIGEYINEVDNRLGNHILSDRERRRLFNELCKMCSRHRVIPKSMHIPDCSQGSVEVAYGGSANVCQSVHNGRRVAIKTLRVHNDLDVILSRFCREGVAWKHLRHPNILPLLGVTISEQRFAMVSEWMDNGNINQFTEKDQLANRPMLLVDVANGLRYLHDLQIVHGDLKGANILINRDKRACIADFGLVTTNGVATNDAAQGSQISLFTVDSLMSFTPGGTYRWMSPELLDPEGFGTLRSEKGNRPTTQSDCYAFGMVIYEVLCGHHPYIEIVSDVAVVYAITDGYRPAKPKWGSRLGFTENLWKMLEQCWLEDCSARPSVEDILPYLNDATLHWYAGTVTPGNDGSVPISTHARAQAQFSTRTGSPLAGAGWDGSGNRDPSDPKHSPLQQPISTFPGSPSRSRLNGCNKPVFVDDVTDDSSEYCPQGYREDVVILGQARSCIMCQKMPRGHDDHFCSRACREKALSA